jgi:integral membrane sensor domain MASE1
MASADGVGARPDRSSYLGHAALVAGIYYVGSWAGNALRFPPATPSVLWPPNAILAAALIALPPRRWWIPLLAALPAHFLFQRGSGWPLSLVAALYFTNCSEALIVAAVAHRLSDDPTRFDGLRRVAALLVAIVTGVVGSSFLDAAVVHAIRGEAFNVVWRVRVFSNVLTELCVLPPMVVLFSRRPISAVTAVLRPRLLEAAFIAVGTVLIGTLALGDTPLSGAAVVVPIIPIALLPLLFLAGVRFGVTGISMVGLGLAGRSA